MKKDLIVGQDKAAKVIKKSVTVGFPVIKVTLLLFIIMKVFNLGIVGNWAWGWVLSPVWIPFAVVAALIIAVLTVIGGVLGAVTLYYWIEAIREKRKRKKLLLRQQMTNLDLWSGRK